MTITLSADQNRSKNVLTTFLHDKTKSEIVLSGSAGTGKSTLVRELLREARNPGLQKMLKLVTGSTGDPDIYLTATTNKAAKVLADSTGEPTTTIHSLLGLIPVNDYKTGTTKLKIRDGAEIIKSSIIYIDEASMVDAELLRKIRDRTLKCKLIFIGDDYQLPPVFETNSEVFTTIADQTKLTTIQRQAANNPIIQFSQEFRDAQDGGPTPVLRSIEPEILHLESEDFKVELETAFQGVSPPDHYKVLAWSNRRVHQYNDYIREEVIGLPKEIQAGEAFLTNKPINEGSYGNERMLHRTDSIVYLDRVGIPDLNLIDPIMQAEFTKHVPGQFIELHSGYCGYLPDNQNEAADLIKYYAKHKNWQFHFAAKDFFLDLRHVHASTVTKSQGSTYHTVFIDVSDIAKNTKNHEVLRLMYTAITRASHKIIMRGNLPARMYK